MESNDRQPPALRAVMHLAVEVAAPISLGELAGEERRMIPILAGRVEVAGFSGSILPGGSDVQSVRADGTIDLLARYAADMGAAGKLLIENAGIRRTPEGAPPYFRGVMRFTAAAGPLQFLNDAVFVSRGRRDGNTVLIEVFELL